jgi:hypothetical protein
MSHQIPPDLSGPTLDAAHVLLWCSQSRQPFVKCLLLGQESKPLEGPFGVVEAVNGKHQGAVTSWP